MRKGASMDHSGRKSGVEDVLRPVEEILEDFDNTMLIAAWNAVFPTKGRSQASFDAERVFQRYFGEYAFLREAHKACLRERDEYRDEMDRLREENEKLRAQLTDLTKE